MTSGERPPPETATQTDWQVCHRLLRESRTYAAHLVAILLLSLCAAPIALLLPLPLQVVVDSVIGTSPLPQAFQVLWQGRSLGADELLVICAVLLVVLSLLQQIEGFASWLLQLYTGERLVLDFRAKLFEQLQRLSMVYHDRAGTADSVYRIQYDAPAVQYVIVSGLIPAFTSAVTVTAMLYVITRIDVTLAAVAGLVVPALFLLTEWYRRRIRDRWTRVKEQESQAMGVVQEVLSLLRVVKAFGQEERERHRFSTASSRVLAAQLRVVRAEAGFGLAVGATLAAGTATVLYVGVRAQQAGTMTLGQLLLVMSYLAQLYRPLEMVSRKIAALQGSLAGARRAFALLDSAPDVPPPSQPVALQRARGHFTFDRVWFGYRDDSAVLRDISFDIPAGARVGVFGRTGAGKTTLVHLLPRFHDPTSGRILLDGIDLRHYDLTDLRRQCAVVLQEPVLFSTTIAENIAYGRSSASRNEVEAAARAANAHDFICRLPAGYDTLLGERGMTLSGGERQRVAVARAFLKDAPILILDEPTSAIDAASEASVIDATRRLMSGRTTFLISHRPKTLEGCDLLLKVESGVVTRVDETEYDEKLSEGHPA